MVIKDKIISVHKPQPKYQILKEMSDRWSPRFYSSKKIPQKHLDIIFEAARWAPSGHNRQPWQYYYVHKGKESYDKLFKTLDEYNQSWAQTAPLLILACAVIKNGREDNPYAVYDLGASVITLVYQAQALGYYSRQMALFDSDAVKKVFKLDPILMPYIIIAMGQVGDYNKAPEKIIDMEFTPRPRKSVIALEL